jgi:hypothetical protein
MLYRTSINHYFFINEGSFLKQGVNQSINQVEKEIKYSWLRSEEPPVFSNHFFEASTRHLRFSGQYSFYCRVQLYVVFV